jgi:4-amino-4-deoxy-L-arabinose transferase-like glycosyltransferase
MKKKRLKIYIEVLFIVFAILWMFNEMGGRFYLPLSEPDEAAWIYSGYYFNLYFLKFDLFHKDWNDYDAIDHPPLVKYIVGGTLFLKGYVFDSLDAKEMWSRIPMDDYLPCYQLLKSKLPDNILPLTRLVIFTFAFLSLILFYIFVRNFYGILPAIVSTSLLMSNDIFIRLSTQTIADPVLLFFLAVFLLLSGGYLKSGNNTCLFFGFVLSSFAFLTKLNGLILIFILFFIIIIKNKFHISNYNFKLLFFGFITLLIMTIFINPLFLNSGIQGIVKMVEHRVSHIHFQQETFEPAALLSIGERLKAEIGMIFFRSSMLNKYIKIPFELIMFLIGVYYSVRKKNLILLIILVCFILPTMFILPLNWERYYYTILPFIYIISGVSLNIFKELNRKDLKPWSNKN